MKSNISRNSFDPSKRYSGVYQQQGSLITDADWNEMQDIIRGNIEAALRDIVGAGLPHNGAMAVEIKDAKDFTIKPGRAYAGGNLAEHHQLDQSYLTQIDLPGIPDNRPFAASDTIYLDVWDREVMHLPRKEYGPDDGLVDPAFTSVTTCTRTQRMAQVKILPTDEGDPRSLPNQGSAQIRVVVEPKLSAEIPDTTRPSDYLFRVEVHRVEGTPNAPTCVWLKWSSENASVTCSTNELPDDDGTWCFEYFSLDSEKHLGYQSTQIQKEDSFPLRGPLSKGLDFAHNAKWPFLRRWDGYCIIEWKDDKWQLGEGYDRDQCLREEKDLGRHDHGAVHMFANSNWHPYATVFHLAGLRLEIALLAPPCPPPPVEPLRDNPAPHPTCLRSGFMIGDYWLASIRAQQASIANSGLPVGVRHHYLPLAIIRNHNNHLWADPIVDNLLSGLVKGKFSSLPELTSSLSDLTKSISDLTISLSGLRSSLTDLRSLCEPLLKKEIVSRILQCEAPVKAGSTRSEKQRILTGTLRSTDEPLTEVANLMRRTLFTLAWLGDFAGQDGVAWRLKQQTDISFDFEAEKLSPTEFGIFLTVTVAPIPNMHRIFHIEIYQVESVEPQNT